MAEERAVYEFQGKSAFRAVDHHWQNETFATCSSTVEIWDHTRAEPIQTFSWGSESVLSVRQAQARYSLIPMSPRCQYMCICRLYSPCLHHVSHIPLL